MTSLIAFEVLGEPNRRAILDLLRNGEQPVGHLVDHLHLSQPGVSKHLRVLKEAGLVEARVTRNAVSIGSLPNHWKHSMTGWSPIADSGVLNSINWKLTWNDGGSHD